MNSSSEITARPDVRSNLAANSLKLDPARKRRRKNKKWWLAAAGAIILILAVMHLHATPEMEFTSVTRERVGAAARPILRISGYIKYDRVVDIGTTEEGPVQELHFVEGSRVQSGQLLAVLENRELHVQKALQAQVTADAERTFRRLERLHHLETVSGSQLEEAELRYNTARLNLDLIAARLDKTYIRAPFAGVITRKLVEVGGFVDKAVATLVDDSLTLVEVDLSQDDLERINPRQPAIVMLDAYPRMEYAANVHKIDPEGDKAKNTVKVKIRVLAPDARFMPDLSAKVFFVEAQETENRPVQTRVVADARSILNENGKFYVWQVDENNRALKREVELGARDSSSVEIKVGVEADARIILDPQQHRLKSGMSLGKNGAGSFLELLHH